MVVVPFHTYSLDSLAQVISTVSLAFSSCESGIRIFWGRAGIHGDDFCPPWCCESSSWQASCLSALPTVLLGSVPTVWRGAARPATFWRLIKIERDYFVWDFTFFKLTHFFFLLELLQNNKMEWICEAIYVMRPVCDTKSLKISARSLVSL